jgi:hypothetical protein
MEFQTARAASKPGVSGNSSGPRNAALKSSITLLLMLAMMPPAEPDILVWNVKSGHATVRTADDRTLFLQYGEGFCAKFDNYQNCGGRINIRLAGRQEIS